MSQQEDRERDEPHLFVVSEDIDASNAWQLKPRLLEQDVEVPGVGTLKVRGLSREEVLGIRAKGETTTPEMERRILALALIDPVLTEDEVGEWQKASAAGEIEKVTDVVMRLSGLIAEAPKQAMAQLRDGPGR